MDESIAMLCIRLLVTEDANSVRLAGEDLRKAIRESIGRVRQRAREGMPAMRPQFETELGYRE